GRGRDHRRLLPVAIHRRPALGAPRHRRHRLGRRPQGPRFRPPGRPAQPMVAGSRGLMPRADFYLIAKPRFLEAPLLLVCELARKASDSGQPLLILATSMAQAEILDELLWEFDPDAYVPHQIAGVDEDDDLTPVL